MAVAYCNTKAILDAVMLESVNSPAMRIKALAWLNQIIRDVLNQPRTWKFLELPVTLPIVANQVTLPAGVQEIIYIKVGDVFLYDLLSDEDAATGIISGYTLTPDGIITIYPATTETTCTLKYEAGLDTKYTDAITATIFPIRFENLLISGTLMKCFKTDKDGRFAAESQLFGYQMSLMKAWDNKLVPMVTVK